MAAKEPSHSSKTTRADICRRARSYAVPRSRIPYSGASFWRKTQARLGSGAAFPRPPRSSPPRSRGTIPLRYTPPLTPDRVACRAFPWTTGRLETQRPLVHCRQPSCSPADARQSIRGSPRRRAARWRSAPANDPTAGPGPCLTLVARLPDAARSAKLVESLKWHRQRPSTALAPDDTAAPHSPVFSPRRHGIGGPQGASRVTPASTRPSRAAFEFNLTSSGCAGECEIWTTPASPPALRRRIAHHRRLQPPSPAARQRPPRSPPLAYGPLPVVLPLIDSPSDSRSLPTNVPPVGTPGARPMMKRRETRPAGVPSWEALADGGRGEREP